MDSGVNAIVNEVNEVDEHDKPNNNSEIQKKKDVVEAPKDDGKSDEVRQADVRGHQSSNNYVTRPVSSPQP